MRYTRRALEGSVPVLCRDAAHARVLTLNRPKALNAMSLPMIRLLGQHIVTRPHPDPRAAVVLKGATPRSFCAGGDLFALVQRLGQPHNIELDWWKYRLVWDQLAAARPQVALWDGHVVGIGAAVSMHGSHRVATETTRYAMPETQIGAYNDSASSWAFARLPLPGLGAYLAVTGNALRGADVYHAGVATHYVPSALLPELEAALCAMANSEEVGGVLDSFHARQTPPPSTLEANADVLASAFEVTAETTVTAIMERLAAAPGAFAASTLATLRRNSPLAMVVALENYKQQAALGPADGLRAAQMDYSLAASRLSQVDFPVGAMAVMAKEPGTPKWQHASAADVDLAQVHAAMRVTDANRFDVAKPPVVAEGF